MFRASICINFCNSLLCIALLPVKRVIEARNRLTRTRDETREKAIVDGLVYHIPFTKLSGI